MHPLLPCNPHVTSRRDRNVTLQLSSRREAPHAARELDGASAAPSLSAIVQLEFSIKVDATWLHVAPLVSPRIEAARDMCRRRHTCSTSDVCVPASLTCTAGVFATRRAGAPGGEAQEEEEGA
jgi:hypothetical protein